MFKSFFSRIFGGWPSDLPRLYPNVDDMQLAQFLSQAEYQRIKAFDNFYILPFVAEGSDEEQTCFGLGLAQLMIRNLMLLRDVSIHGPEDTSSVFNGMAEKLAADNPRSSYVTGVAKLDDRGFALHAEIHRRGRGKTEARVVEPEFTTFLQQCTSTIAENISSEPRTKTPDGWNVGQPASVESLMRCGELHLHFDRGDSRGKSKAAERALAADPGFVVPVWEVDGELPNARPIYLEAIKRDPYNAQLFFLTICNVWKSQRPQAEAVQFCRRAIELSPGHGKAHMCAPHAAPASARMLHHSELGYRLLPGNSFAVNNYTINLMKNGAPVDKLRELGEEGIEMDPCDPGNYLRLIELHCDCHDYRAALRVAERLQKLYEPEYNERTLYCLRENPEMARLIDTGAYDPAKENRKLIAELRGLVRQQV